MNRWLIFQGFGDAYRFLKEIKIGKIQRDQDLSEFGDYYIWESDFDELNEDQKNLLSAADGSRLIWNDPTTGLIWQLESSAFAEDPLGNSGAMFAPEQCGGYEDWRTPTLRELKTLSSSVRNSSGCYAREDLAGLIRGTYMSSTPHNERGVMAAWNFNEGHSDYQDHTEGEIIWDSDGSYSGYKSGHSTGLVNSILVRGEGGHPLDDWAEKLYKWSEHEQLFDFPVKQADIENIEGLHFSSPPPGDFHKLRRLRKIVCSSNSENANALTTAANLTSLIFVRSHRNSSGLEEIPQTVKDLRKLMSLNASGIDLQRIGEAVAALNNLQELDLSDNNIESIPDSVRGLEKLQVMILSGNKIGIIPDCIGDLAELRSLDLAFNPILDISDSICRLQKLEELRIGGAFHHLPASIGSLAKLADLQIVSRALKALPNGIFSLSRLRKLVCRAPLESLEGRLRDLQLLSTLILDNTSLDSIPDEVFAMPWLRELRLTRSPIKLIPDEISAMTSLERLDLSGTELCELPRSFLQLENLAYLNVTGTKIDSLPEWLSEMKAPLNIVAEGVKFPMVLRKGGGLRLRSR